MYHAGKRAARGSGLRSILLGVMCSVLLFAGILSVEAAAAGKGSLPQSWFSAAAFGAYGIACLIGCFLTAKRAGSGKLLRASVTGCILLAAVLGISAACTGIGSPGTLIGITLAAILLGAVLGSRKYQNGYK